MQDMFKQTEVIIAGAGPTGLTLACSLAQQGIRARIFEKSEAPSVGSRGKGIQPRTLEVFHSLGAIQPLLRAGMLYPPMRMHVGFFRWTWHMVKRYRTTPDVPYPNTWLVPQAQTEQVLRDRLVELGGAVEFGSEVVDVDQDHDGVVANVLQGGQLQAVRARYFAAADGGKGGTRKKLGIEFAGTTSDDGRMIVGDVCVEGVTRDAWHVWPTRRGVVALCPLPDTRLFQLMMRLEPDEGEPELSETAIQSRWLKVTGKRKIRLHSPAWLSVFRPNVRLASRYRVGRVFLAGDAAHVHTPAGAQGLNTGIQDAFNLGWKLAATLRGAPDALLGTYEAERRPVAAGVLQLSNEHFESMKRQSLTKMSRGDRERQLTLSYRGSSLSTDSGGLRSGKLRAGDRAPDARGVSTSMFDLYRGGHMTIVVFGHSTGQQLVALLESRPAVRVVHVGSHLAGALEDPAGEIMQVYGVAQGEEVAFVVRPDGYIGLVATADCAASVKSYLGQCWKNASSHASRP
jgi:2-polyprenyl-6-methoxyphenol hydroxylase-like FAD-dependent oxidoreductase